VDDQKRILCPSAHLLFYDTSIDFTEKAELFQEGWEIYLQDSLKGPLDRR
jgi:hypothetical protein